MKPNEQELRAKLHDKMLTNRWLYIADWCKKRGLSPMVAENYQKAAMAWATENSPPAALANAQDEPAGPLSRSAR